jgi:hypothetical protein
MIPNNPKGPELIADHGAKRRVLFNLGDWEVVLYQNYTKSYVVHTCREPIEGYSPSSRDPDRPVAPRAIIRRATIIGSPEATCWNCKAGVPDGVIAVSELYNE